MARSSTKGGASAPAAPKRAAAKRAAPKREAPRREIPKRSGAPELPPRGGLGSVLRGSVNSMMGSVGGLNVPLRAIERLTGAVERAAALLERVERATRHLDELDAGFVDRLYESFEVLADMRKDTRAIRTRVDALESEVGDLQSMLTERLDRVPLIRPSRRVRKAERDDAGGGA